MIVFHVLGIPTRSYSPFITDVRTGEKEQVDPDYIEWVKEEMKHTYADLLKDSENVVLDAAVGAVKRRAAVGQALGGTGGTGNFVASVAKQQEVVRGNFVVTNRMRYFSKTRRTGYFIIDCLSVDAGFVTTSWAFGPPATSCRRHPATLRELLQHSPWSVGTRAMESFYRNRYEV